MDLVIRLACLSVFTAVWLRIAKGRFEKHIRMLFFVYFTALIIIFLL